MNECITCGGQLSKTGDCVPCLFSLGGESLELIDSPLDSIDSYDIEKRIATGGMSIVYRAYQPELNRTVALKVLSDRGLGSADALRRFQTETEAVATLDHRYIIPIYESNIEEGMAYYSMPYLSGGTLADLIKKGELDSIKVAQIIRKVAEAISYAHSRGVLHRDLKPSNILLDENEEPQLADFGVAKLEKQDTVVTIAGMVLGTPAYMAPEQASGRENEVTISSDIYSLGVILYEMITGVLPFQSGNQLELLKQVIEDEPQAPKTIMHDVSDELSTIALKAMEKNPERRYRSAGELEEDLQRFLDGRPILAKPPSTYYLVSRFIKRHTFVVAAAAITILSILGGAIVSTSLYFKQKETLMKAEIESGIRSEVAGVLSEALSAAGTSYAMGRDATMMKEVLDKTVKRLDEADINPLVEIELRKTVGNTYRDLYEVDNAEANFKRALELRRTMVKNDNDEMLLVDALNDYTESLVYAYQTRDAEKYTAEAMSILEKYKDDADYETRYGRALALRARILYRHNDIDRSFVYAEPAYEIALKYPSERFFIHASSSMRMCYRRKKMPRKALEVNRHLVKLLKENYPPNHPEISRALGYLGRILCVLKRYDEAEKILQEAEAINAKTFTRGSQNGYQVHRYLSEIAASKGDEENELHHANLSAELSKKTYPEKHYYRRLGAEVLELVLYKQLFEALTFSEPRMERAEMLFQRLKRFYSEQNKVRKDLFCLTGMKAFRDYLKGDKSAKDRLENAFIEHTKLRSNRRNIKIKEHLQQLVAIAKD